MDACMRQAEIFDVSTYFVCVGHTGILNARKRPTFVRALQLFLLSICACRQRKVIRWFSWFSYDFIMLCVPSSTFSVASNAN